MLRRLRTLSTSLSFSPSPPPPTSSSGTSSNGTSSTSSTSTSTSSSSSSGTTNNSGTTSSGKRQNTSSPSNFPTFHPIMSSSLPKCENVIFHTKGPIRIVELNRPNALHAINVEMVDAITEALRIWQSNPNCKIVVLKADNSGTKSKAFCAGGDVISLVTSNLPNREKAEFFKKEYCLNHLIGTFNKPIISVLDGITMGGGVGLSLHGQYRIATENTIFAMPETAIGFFPDVGGSFFLPRLDGSMGTFLALTGSRIKGYDNYHLGIATHFIPSSRVDDFLESLYHSQVDPGQLSSYLEQFSGELEPFSLAPLVKEIDRCFSPNQLSDIIRNLEDSSNLHQSWAKDTLTLIRTLSPTALKATLNLLIRGKSMTFKNCLRMEYNLGRNFLDKVIDMRNGIISKLVKKEKNPKWSPETIEQVSDEFINSLFTTNDDKDGISERLEFMNNIDFEQYPHQGNALPSIDQIKQIVQQNRNLSNWNEIVDKICKERYNKIGLREKLEEVIPKHVKSREELEKDGRIAVTNLTWVE